MNYPKEAPVFDWFNSHVIAVGLGCRSCTTPCASYVLVEDEEGYVYGSHVDDLRPLTPAARAFAAIAREGER